MPTVRSGLRTIVILVVLACCSAGCKKKGGGGGDDDPTGVGGPSLTLSSSAFSSGGAIPLANSSYGANQSPALAWTEPPVGTTSFAIICTDPDANGFVHWLVADIPGGARSLPAALVRTAYVQGANDFGNVGYDGPEPPDGTHRYVFTIYAVDSAALGLSAGASEAQIRSALTGHTLATGSLTGTFTAPAGAG
jgi:Raf kinase inhibitor-like YbhB/YbcL family protein